MKTERIAIIGGGLSGLYAAALLEARGIKDYVVLEARGTFGGRIISVPNASNPGWNNAGRGPITGRFDLGATWFWPALHPELQQLVDQLGPQTVQQHETGEMLIERSRTDPPNRIEGFLSAPSPLRLVGGMGALVDAVRNRLPGDRLVAGQQVKRLLQQDSHIEVETQDRLGQAVSYHVAHVLLAVPPRLVATTIDFVPTLPDTLARQWKACATWMAPHAKYVAVFDTPFWREQGLSGGARSTVGPMAEIHDASAIAGQGALFGFLGVPTEVRRQVPEDVLLSHCRAQFVRLFGGRAAKPVAEFFKDWASDSYTSVAADEHADGHHSFRLSTTSSEEPWKNRIIGIASEWSPSFSGYVAGAIEAARLGVEAMLAPGPASTLARWQRPYLYSDSQEQA